MTKKSQVKQTEQIDSNSRPFHISVAASAKSDFTLADEVNMLKFGLLYGEKVTLYSLGSTFNLHLTTTDQMPFLMKLDGIESLVRGHRLIPSHIKRRLMEDSAFYREVNQSQRPLSQEELRRKFAFEHFICQSWPVFRELIEEFFVKKGGGELLRALNTPFVERYEFERSSRDWQEEFLTVVGQTIIEGATYPLFDSETAGLLRSGTQANTIKPSQPSTIAGKQVGLAADLLTHLPLFPDASVDQILDIRKELNKPVTHFRSAMIKYARSIESASWDKDFPFEADQVFREMIAPEIQKLQTEIDQNRYLRELLPKLPTAPMAVPAGSFLSAIVAKIAEWPELAAHGLGLGVVTALSAAALAAWNAKVEHKKKQIGIEQNGLFFYIKADKLLQKKVKKR